MAEVSSELIYEVLKQVRDDVSSLKLGQSEIKAEMQAFRGHLVAVQQDIHNIYAILVRHETRLDRIERRLGLMEPATA
jgi:hypothetical protein